MNGGNGHSRRGQCMSTAKKVKLSKKWIICIAIACAALLVIVICILGFREGGWFRGNGHVDETQSFTGGDTEPTGNVDVDVEPSIPSLTEYAKQLEANGNKEAAAAVYELIAAYGDGALIRKANEEIPVVKENNAIRQFKEFMSGSREKGGN